MKKKCRECEDYGDIVVFSVLSDCLELTVTRDQQLHIEPGHEISQRQSVHIEPQLTWSDEMTHQSPPPPPLSSHHQAHSNTDWSDQTSRNNGFVFSVCKS